MERTKKENPEGRCFNVVARRRVRLSSRPPGFCPARAFGHDRNTGQKPGGRLESLTLRRATTLKQRPSGFSFWVRSITVAAPKVPFQSRDSYGAVFGFFINLLPMRPDVHRADAWNNADRGGTRERRAGWNVEAGSGRSHGNPPRTCHAIGPEPVSHQSQDEGPIGMAG